MQRKNYISEEYKTKAIERLHSEGCSCVITDGEVFQSYHQRGVKDLYEILSTQPEVLCNAFIADKVVGKGAAALMILGGVTDMHADVLSRPAAELLDKESTPYTYGKLVDNIINRRGDGICPVESLCQSCTSATECLPLIKNFIIQAQ